MRVLIADYPAGPFGVVAAPTTSGRTNGGTNGDAPVHTSRASNGTSSCCPSTVVTSVFGPVTFRAVDQQSTFGAFVGRLDLKGERGVMVDWRYADGKDYMPSDAAVKKRRPAEAMR